MDDTNTIHENDQDEDSEQGKPEDGNNEPVNPDSESSVPGSNQTDSKLERDEETSIQSKSFSEEEEELQLRLDDCEDRDEERDQTDDGVDDNDDDSDDDDDGSVSSQSQEDEGTTLSSESDSNPDDGMIAQGEEDDSEDTLTEEIQCEDMEMKEYSEEKTEMVEIKDKVMQIQDNNDADMQNEEIKDEVMQVKDSNDGDTQVEENKDEDAQTDREGLKETDVEEGGQTDVDGNRQVDEEENIQAQKKEERHVDEQEETDEEKVKEADEEEEENLQSKKVDKEADKDDNDKQADDKIQIQVQEEKVRPADKEETNQEDEDKHQQAHEEENRQTVMEVSKETDEEENTQTDEEENQQTLEEESKETDEEENTQTDKEENTQADKEETMDIDEEENRQTLEEESKETNEEENTQTNEEENTQTCEEETMDIDEVENVQSNSEEAHQSEELQADVEDERQVHEEKMRPADEEEEKEVKEEEEEEEEGEEEEANEQEEEEKAAMGEEVERVMEEEEKEANEEEEKEANEEGEKAAMGEEVERVMDEEEKETIEEEEKEANKEEEEEANEEEEKASMGEEVERVMEEEEKETNEEEENEANEEEEEEKEAMGEEVERVMEEEEKEANEEEEEAAMGEEVERVMEKGEEGEEQQEEEEEEEQEERAVKEAEEKVAMEEEEKEAEEKVEEEEEEEEKEKEKEMELKEDKEKEEEKKERQEDEEMDKHIDEKDDKQRDQEQCHVLGDAMSEDGESEMENDERRMQEEEGNKGDTQAEEENGDNLQLTQEESKIQADEKGEDTISSEGKELDTEIESGKDMHLEKDGNEEMQAVQDVQMSKDAAVPQCDEKGNDVLSTSGNEDELAVEQKEGEENSDKSPILGQKHKKKSRTLFQKEDKESEENEDSLQKDDGETPPQDDSEETQASRTSPSTKTSPIIGFRSKEIYDSPKHVSATPHVSGLPSEEEEEQCDLVITSVRGNVSEMTSGPENSNSSFPSISEKASLTSTDKNNQSTDSESSDENTLQECKAVVCENCRCMWTDKVLYAIFKGTEPVTVNSRITFGALVLINNWAHKNLRSNKDIAVRHLLERADLGNNIQSLNINDLSNWLSDLMGEGKIRCCAVFDAIYKPEPIEVSLGSLKKNKSTSDQNWPVVASKKRPLPLEQENDTDDMDEAIKNLTGEFERMPHEIKTNKKQKKDVEESEEVSLNETPAKDEVASTIRTEPDDEISMPMTDQERSISPMSTEDQSSTDKQYLPETELSQETKSTDDQDVTDGDPNVAIKDENCAPQEEKPNTPDTTEESPSLPSAIEGTMSSFCEKLGLDRKSIDISCHKRDTKRICNREVIGQRSGTQSHDIMLKERSALNGFAKDAFDLMPFETDNICQSVDSKLPPERFMTNRELLTLHNIFILNAEFPDADLFYQILIQILMIRRRVLLVPDSRTLLQVVEKLRRDFNRANARKSYNTFLGQDWDVRNTFTAEDVWTGKRTYPSEPSIGDILSVFCLWRNLGKEIPDFSISLVLQQMCKDTDLNSADKLGTCIRLYARFCAFLYKENSPEIAAFFLSRKATGSNMSISKEALLNGMKEITSEGDDSGMSPLAISNDEKDIITVLQNCVEAEKMAIQYVNAKSLRNFHNILKQFERKLEVYKENNKDIGKKIRTAEARKEELMKKIENPNAKLLVNELSDNLASMHQNRRKIRQLNEVNESSAKYQRRGDATDVHSLRVESDSETVSESTKEAIYEILTMGVKPEQVRTVIQTVMNKVMGESAQDLPDVCWIRKYAQENSLLIGES